MRVQPALSCQLRVGDLCFQGTTDASLQEYILEKSLDISAGDFIYVPPDSVHQPVNDSLSETMELIVARNAPVEIVVEFDPETGQPVE